MELHEQILVEEGVALAEEGVALPEGMAAGYSEVSAGNTPPTYLIGLLCVHVYRVRSDYWTFTSATSSLLVVLL